MKKTLFAVVLAIMLAATPALAVEQGQTFGTNASGHYVAGTLNGPVTFSGDYGSSGGNDYASTSGGAAGQMVNDNRAFGKYFSFQAGYASMDANLNSCVGAYDNGQTSASWAKGTVSADGQAGGIATSGWKPSAQQTSTSSGWVAGGVGQYNTANEANYAQGQYATAENGSNAHFYNQAQTSSNSGWLGAASGTCVAGSAEVTGSSKVTIDPSGNTRSAQAYTTNTAKGNDGVGGFGNVNAMSANGYQSAQAYSGFQYSGNNAGTGTAQANTSITQGQNSFSSKSYGYSVTGTKANCSTPR